jgi:hypothetical protein
MDSLYTNDFSFCFGMDDHVFNKLHIFKYYNEYVHYDTYFHTY